MKLQRYWVGNEEGDGWPEADGDGKWVRSDDAEELETAVERATANMVAAQNRAAELEGAMRELDHKYRIACDVRDIRGTKLLQAKTCIAELEKALKKIASFDGKYHACDCGYCMICIAKEALGAKDKS
jgi:hypothetical protein